MPTAHDQLFRATFQHPHHVIGLVKSLVPARIADRFDWTTLVLESGAFVDESSARHADLLFSVRTVDDPRPLLLYVVIEHQSSAEPLMSLRAAGYVVRALERYAETHEGVRKLPAVLPLVVSHCERPWDAATDLHALYGVDPSVREWLAPYLLGIRYIVDDLSGQTEAMIRRRALTARATVALLSLRAVRIARVFSEAFVRWADLLKALAPDELDAVLVYALRVGEEPPEALRDVLQSHVSPEAGELTMTTAERLRKEGWKQGEVHGMARILLGQLRLKFIEVPEQTRQRVTTATPQELERWSQRVISAVTLADVFAEADN